MSIDLRSITFSYPGKPAVLRSLSLLLQQGEKIALVGPSGSGKSTVLGILGLLHVPTEGSVLWDGVVVSPGSREAHRLRRRHVAWIFQSTNVVPYRNAVDNVALPLWAAGATVRSGREAASEFLRRVGLSDRDESDVREMSGGEVQRLCLARALVRSPKLLLADEPTGQLDSYNTSMVIDALDSLRESSAIAVATHDERVAAACDRVIEIGV